MHDLQPLSSVAIKDAGLPPMVEQYTESFGEQGYYGVFDLMVRLLRGLCLGVSQQLLCPLNIFLITCLHFSVFPSYEYSTALEFLHSTTNICIFTIWYLGSYSVSLRFSLRLWISGAHSILHLLNILSLRLWISDLSCIAS